MLPLLDNRSCADLLKVLATHKNSPIRRALPDNVRAADKPGELEAVRNDTEKVKPLLDEHACVCWHDALESGYGYGVARAT